MTVLLQEIEKFNGLINTIERSLEGLKAGLKGQALMTADLDNMLVALQNN